MESVCIPKAQQEFQAATEALSLIAAVPTLVLASQEESLPRAARLAMGALAAAHAVNDGGLLLTWGKHKKGNRHCITPARKAQHVVTELAVVVGVVPFLWWAANEVAPTNPSLAFAIRALAVAEAAIDVWLLAQWPKLKPRKPRRRPKRR